MSDILILQNDFEASKNKCKLSSLLHILFKPQDYDAWEGIIERNNFYFMERNMLSDVYVRVIRAHLLKVDHPRLIGRRQPQQNMIICTPAVMRENFPLKWAPFRALFNGSNSYNCSIERFNETFTKNR